MPDGVKTASRAEELAERIEHLEMEVKARRLKDESGDDTSGIAELERRVEARAERNGRSQSAEITPE